MGLFKWLEKPLLWLLSTCINFIDYVVHIILLQIKGKKYLTHDLRGEYKTDLQAAPYKPTEKAKDKLNLKDYEETEGYSPIYRHLLSHTEDGSRIDIDNVLDEIITPESLRDQVDKEFEDFKERAYNNVKKGNLSGVPRENKVKVDRKVPETTYDFYEALFEFYSDRTCLVYRKLKEMHSEKRIIGGKEKDWLVPRFEETKEEMSYKKVKETVEALAKAMQKCFNLESSAGDNDFFDYDKVNDIKKHDRFAIFDDTSADWFLFAQALFKQNVALVTVYATLGLDSLVTALNESQVVGIMLNYTSLKDSVPLIVEKCPKIKYIVYNLRNCDSSTKEKVEQREKLLNELNGKYSEKVVLITIDELIEMGLQDNSTFQIRGKKQSREDISLIMYTSGTTSIPKGVQITNWNLLSTVSSFNVCLGTEREIEYTHLAYLPLAHILEFLVESIILLRGGKVAFGNARYLVDGSCQPCGDLRAFRPTIFVGVPKVFDTIKKQALLKVNGSGYVVRKLFDMAYNCKVNAIANKRETPIWDLLVFNRFKEVTGGNIKAMLVGGAPLVESTHKFIRAITNALFIVGLGLTETCAGAAINNIWAEFSTGNCGPCVPVAEIRLRDVPDMGYTHNDKPNPRGELLIRGRNVCVGYLKQKQLTLEAFGGKLPSESKDVLFFETGDIAEILPNGTVKIIDRKKNLVKLMSGEYVALSKLESVYGDSPFVQPNGIFVHGSSFGEFPIAFIMPQHKYLTSVAEKLGINYKDEKELLHNDKIINEVHKSFDQLASKNKLATYERVKKFKLCEEEWTVENGLLTATQKLKRNAIADFYKKDIEHMYKE
ncbi:hypothetical protein ABK040_005761 [Willaertia magna]